MTGMRIVFVVMILPFFLSVSPASSTESDAEELLSRISEAVANLDAVKGTFRQEVEMTLMEETKSYSGRIYYMHPDLLRLEYDKPSGQLLICDGSFFWMYLTDKERPQAFKTPAGGEIGGFISHSTLAVLVDRYDSKLEKEEEVEGVPCYQIFFTPRDDNPAARFQTLRLWVGKADLLSKRLSYQDLAGNQITYSFYGWLKLDSLPIELFTFTPTSDMDVFDNH